MCVRVYPCVLVRVCVCMHACGNSYITFLLVSSSHAMQRLTFLPDSIQSIIFTHEIGHNLGMQHDDGSKLPLGPSQTAHYSASPFCLSVLPLIGDMSPPGSGQITYPHVFFEMPEHCSLYMLHAI